jgi:hypothetical protein
MAKENFLKTFAGDFFKKKPDITFGSTLQAAGSIFSGVSAYGASRQAAEQLKAQGAVSFAESIRSANIIREEGAKFAAKQSLQYIGAGVQLVGTPLITTAQTKKYAETEARAVERRGRNLRSLADSQAQAKKDEGRAALIGGIVNTVGAFY